VAGISNTLRRRLEIEPTPQVHPEADVLVAYLEHALPAAEKDQVMGHLAVCAECRDVAILSLPPKAEQSLVRPVPGKTPFRPVGLRWAALIATMATLALVAPLAVKQPWKNRGSAHTVTLPSHAAANNEIASLKTPAPVLSSPPVAVTSDLVSKKAQPNAGAPGRTSDLEAVTVIAKEGFINKTRFAREDEVNSQVFRGGDNKTSDSELASVRVANTNSSRNFAGTLDQFNSPASVLADLSKTGDPKEELQPGSGLPLHQSVFRKVERPFTTALKKLPPIMVGGLEAKTMSVGPPKSAAISSDLISAAPAPGKDTLAAPSAETSSLSLADSAAFTKPARASATVTIERRHEAAQPAEWKVEEGKLLKSYGESEWQDVYPQHDVPSAFFTVATHGNDIWAGGTHATLVHSRDGGIVWEEVKLGNNASGTVNAITINGLNIQIKTSTQQTWASQDGGQNWIMQPLSE